jgi:hypothetical protein
MARQPARLFPQLFALLLALLLALAAGPADAQNRFRLTGVVVASETGQPLAYSIIASPSMAVSFFANDSGRFAISNLPVGSVEITVRRLGYVPATVSAHIRGDASDTIVIKLSRVVVHLDAVTVRAHPLCTNPGPPRAASDTALASIFEQLRLNAEQYRLLSYSYPFIYAMDVQRSLMKSGSIVAVDGLPERLINSGRDRRYAPGTAIVPRDREWFFEIPTLLEFADSGFVAVHCFHLAGVESFQDSSFIRVDVVAADSIKDADVDGSIYLHPTTFQIRRTVLVLSKPARRLPALAGLEVTTDFKEVLPSISIVGHVLGVETVRPEPLRDYDEAREEQATTRVMFLGSIPGKDALTRKKSP